MAEIERRTFTRDAAPTVKEGRMYGKAAPFNSETMIGRAPWGFREKIAPGCFKKSINDGDVVLLDQHDTAKPLARQSAGTLNLREGKTHLEWDADEPDTTYGQDAMKNTRNGNYGGCSFGFEVIRDRWTDDEGNEADAQTGTHRELQEVRLIEISTVTFPAYTDTSVSSRDAVNAARGVEEDRGPKPYGDVKYADPKNGKYPIDTKEHAKAAWSYINMPKNAAKYPLNGVSLASVKAKIKAACKHFGISVGENSDTDPEYADPYDNPWYEREETSGESPGDGEPEEASTRDFDELETALSLRVMDSRR